MKKIGYLCILLIGLGSCQEVIDVELSDDVPRLILDAVIRVDTSLPIQTISITAALSSSFFAEITPASLEQISIVNLSIPPEIDIPNRLELIEITPGTYEANVPTILVVNGVFVLEVLYEGQNYEATASYIPSSPVDALEQRDGTLFSDDDTEVAITFTDNPQLRNFYIFDFDFNEFLVSEDTFYNGQQFEFSYFYDERLSPGQEVEINILGADLPFFTFMDEVITQAGGAFTPFATPAATVRGNISNTTDPENFALGYFAVVETFAKTILIE